MSEKKMKYLKIFSNFLLLGIIIFACIEILPFLANLFMPFIIAYVIALIAEPIVRLLEKIKIKRKYSAFGIIFLIIGLIVACIYYLIKWLYNLVMSLASDWTHISLQITTISSKFDNIFKRFNINIDDSGMMATISKFVNNFSESFINSGSTFVTNIPMIIFMIVVIFMSSYFLIQTHNDFIKKMVEENERLEKVKVIVVDQVFKYIKAQFKIMMVIFVIIAIGLGLLGIKYFIPLALLIAFVDLLPILGTGTIMIPWGIIDIVYGDYARAMFIFAIYLIAMITRQILQPKIIGETMEFPALPTLVVMWVGYKLFNVAGLLLSVPVGILLSRLYKAGVFDVYKDSIIYIYNDLKHFLKIDFNNKK